MEFWRNAEIQRRRRVDQFLQEVNDPQRFINQGFPHGIVILFSAAATFKTKRQLVMAMEQDKLYKRIWVKKIQKLMIFIIYEIIIQIQV